MRAAAESAVVTDQPPVFAAIIRAPELAAIGFLAVDRHAIAGFDQRVDAIGI